jgi:preprotein translocase subunit SecG
VLTILFVIQTILAIALIVAILLQVKGQGFNGSFGGGDGSIQRTRRGVEKTLFQFTIGLTVVFMILAVVTSVYKG